MQNSQSVPPAYGGGAYKYSGGGIGGAIGTLGQGPSYNFANIPKYSSGIAGGIGSLGGNDDGGGMFGGRTKY